MLRILLIFVAAAVGVVGGPATSVQAQVYTAPGATVLGQVSMPPYSYSYAQPGLYPYGYAYPFGPWYVFPSVPPPSRYISPPFSYQANPYAPFPNSFSYEVPPYTYTPNSFTYDLRAYGYPWGIYPSPSYPYGYYWYYYNLGPRYRRGVYRQMSLREYTARQLHGPTRVRDIVPGVPELSVR